MYAMVEIKIRLHVPLYLLHVFRKLVSLVTYDGCIIPVPIILHKPLECFPIQKMVLLRNLANWFLGAITAKIMILQMADRAPFPCHWVVNLGFLSSYSLSTTWY